MATSSCSKYVSYTDTINVNGVNLFYCVEGKGKPVITLHGNGGSHNDLETTNRQLAQAGYRVYSLDSRGQGSNPPLEEYHYIDMANDVKAFIDTLGIKRPAVFGFSDGGIIALQLEVLYPNTTSMIITSGANITPDDSITPEFYHQCFDHEYLPPLTRMMKYEPNMTDAQISRIPVPALICAGENDLILRDHTWRIANGIPNGKMYIFPGHDHGSHIWHNTLMGKKIISFLKGQGY